jgi:hypothetical protein
MATLTLQAPQWQFEPTGPSAQLEKPVTVKLPPITYADGQAATQGQLQQIGAFVYRSKAGAEELWNEAQQAWQPSTTDLATLATLTPIPLAFKEGQPQPWQGLLVAAGQKDKDSAARFAKAFNGEPVYRVRALARFQRDGAVAQALSAPSADLTFISAADSQRFAIALDTQTAADCTVARIQLKTAALQPAAFIELRASGPELEIASCDAAGQLRARVVLTAAGDIELRPLAGRRVIVYGDLETDHLRYLPAAGSVKQEL